MKLKIKKKWLKDPEALGAALERLMIEHGRRANKCLEDASGGFLTKPRDQDEAWHSFCNGRAEGLNDAWKLIFGFDSEESLKS